MNQKNNLHRPSTDPKTNGIAGGNILSCVLDTAITHLLEWNNSTSFFLYIFSRGEACSVLQTKPSKLY